MPVRRRHRITPKMFLCSNYPNKPSLLRSRGVHLACRSIMLLRVAEAKVSPLRVNGTVTRRPSGWLERW
jgi:hypothetical protein